MAWFRKKKTDFTWVGYVSIDIAKYNRMPMIDANYSHTDTEVIHLFECPLTGQRKTQCSSIDYESRKVYKTKIFAWLQGADHSILDGIIDYRNIYYDWMNTGSGMPYLPSKKLQEKPAVSKHPDDYYRGNDGA